MSLTTTPSANRLHIGIFGKRNSGKSSLINAITNQDTALTSEVAGTTTDPVYKAMEIHGIGPCMLIDTAGFDDEGELGALRVRRTRDALEKTDVAIVVFCEADVSLEADWIGALQERGTPVVAVINKADLLGNVSEIARAIHDAFSLFPIVVSAKERTGVKDVIEAVIRQLPEDYEKKSITAGLVGEGDVVLLVMPQDIQAPKGRLILPQVQTIRDLLDNRCVVLSVTADKLDEGLAALREPPRPHHHRLAGLPRRLPEKAARKPAHLLFGADGGRQGGHRLLRRGGRRDRRAHPRFPRAHRRGVHPRPPRRGHRARQAPPACCAGGWAKPSPSTWSAAPTSRRISAATI